jgi:hypothetical protein
MAKLGNLALSDPAQFPKTGMEESECLYEGAMDVPEEEKRCLSADTLRAIECSENRMPILSYP